MSNQLNKKNPSSGPKKLYHNTEYNSDHEIAECFNTYFTSFGHHQLAEVDSASTNIIATNKESFSFSASASLTIEKFLNNVNIQKAETNYKLSPLQKDKSCNLTTRCCGALHNCYAGNVIFEYKYFPVRTSCILIFIKLYAIFILNYLNLNVLLKLSAPKLLLLIGQYYQ